MARPRSKDKEMALLRSAVKTIATQGLRASTVMIARYAGVAEGTLFLYFSTKDVLLSAVFEHLLQDLEASLAFCLPACHRDRPRNPSGTAISTGARPIPTRIPRSISCWHRTD